MSEAKQKFTSKWGFLFACMGSAIGLGNIWRFPSQAYESGGGAFIIPYLVALITTGIPLMIMEFGLGSMTQGSAAKAFGSINRRLEPIGWFQSLVSFSITTYYHVILAYISIYTIASYKLSWGSDTASFFYKDVANLSDSITHSGVFSDTLFSHYTILWAIVASISFFGVKKGIEKVNKLFIPILVTIFFLIVVYSLTLPGALDGLNAFFEPDFSKILDLKIWLNAYSQVFFTLSIALGIMVTYSSYAERKTDLTSSAIITSLANSSIELLSGIGIFASLGFMAHKFGLEIDNVVEDGFSLVFVVLPEVFNNMPMGEFIGLLFFTSLLIAGVSSVISLLEVLISSLVEKFDISRKLVVLSICFLGYSLGLVFLFQNGLFLFDIFDNGINKIAFIFSGIVEILFIALIFKKVDAIIIHSNENSSIKLNRFYKYSLYVSLLVLSTILILNIVDSFFKTSGGYNDYGAKYNLILGLLPFILCVTLSLIITRFSRKRTIKKINYDD